MPGRSREIIDRDSGENAEVSTNPSSTPESNQRPGRWDPVRGDPSQQLHSETPLGSGHRNLQLGQQQNRLQPSRAVPISSHIASNYFPPSPPSTIASSSHGGTSPPDSPAIELTSFHLGGTDTIPEEEAGPLDEETRDGVDPAGNIDFDGRRRITSSGSDELAAAAQAVAGPSKSSKALEPHLSNNKRHDSGQSVLSNPFTSAQPLVTPDKTPNAISPACTSLAHHPVAASKRFFSSIFEDFPTGIGSEHVVGATEEANLDLVCPGWSGAILDRSRLHSVSSIPPLSTSHASVASMSSVLTHSSTATRALYTLLPNDAVAERLREDLLAILDTASEQLHCDVVFTILDRGNLEETDWKALLHGLCYVGGSVVTGGQDRLTGCTVKRGLVLVAVEV